MIKFAKTRKSIMVPPAKRSVSAMLLLWGLTAGFLGGSYYLSAQSSLPAWTSIKPRVLYHVVHIVEFAILAVILCMALRQTFISTSLLLPAVLAFVGATAWAFADEYHQMSVPGRRGCFSESLIDIFGAIVGITVWMGIVGLRKLKQTLTAPSRHPKGA